VSDEPINRPPLPLMREISRVPILFAFNREGDDLDWHNQAACNGLGDVMFPKAQPGRIGADYREALSICRGCPVVNECLTWALAAEEPHGCWGGMAPAQRRRLAREPVAS
jgi:WhiB family transcriptional regulator, redox-sensing transcriptional regulator